MSISFPLPQLSVIDVSDETGQSDLASVERAKQDPGAFAELYGRYLDPVCQYCFRRLGSREAGEDATSQVFMQALAGLPRFDGYSLLPGMAFQNCPQRGHRPVPGCVPNGNARTGL